MWITCNYNLQICYTANTMKKKKKLPLYIAEKRKELMFALASQGYRPVDIQQIFGFDHMVSVTRILAKMPKDYKSPWVKQK